MAMETNAPSTIPAMARTAAEAQQATAPPPREVPLAARPQAPARAPGIVQRKLRELGIRDALLLRAASIDEATNNLFAEATAKSQGQDAAARWIGEGNGLSEAGCHAAQLAAKDSPASVLRLDQQDGKCHEPPQHTAGPPPPRKRPKR